MNLKNLLFDELKFGACVLGIGTFDGVHIGHQKLIQEVIKKAKKLNLPSVILTFDHSPKKFLNPEGFPGYLTTPAEKFNLLFSLGVDYVVFRPFDSDFAKLDYKEFIDDIVINKLNSQTTIVGFNFCFGLNRAGNAENLIKELNRKNRDCMIIPPVKIDEKVVSSSYIREIVSKGDFETANKYLGRVASISGEVIHGDHRGREMGFPTANVLLEKSSVILPPNGVYGCYVETPEGNFPSIVNIGFRPTFKKKCLLLEAHLMGFEGNLYHRVIRVSFLTHVRDEIKFPDMKELIIQIKKDQDTVKKYFDSQKQA